MKKNSSLKILLTFFLTIYFTSQHAQQYYPDTEWRIKKPEELKTLLHLSQIKTRAS